MGKKKGKRTIAGTVRYCEYKLFMVITGIPAVIIFCMLGYSLLTEELSVLSLQGFWIWFVIAFLLLLVFWKHFRYSIQFSEKQAAFIVNTMFSHKTYFTADITSIQPMEVRFTVTSRHHDPDCISDFPLYGVHDEEERFLVIQIGRRKLRVNRSSEGTEQFHIFLRKTTPPEIWQETALRRIWTLNDLFVSSKDDPWEIARKEQKRKKKAE